MELRLGKVEWNLLTFLRQIYLLEVVGGVGITCLGWVACYLTGGSWVRSAPLWLGGYLLVYNLDRLHYDPADRENTPTRFLCRESLRPKTTDLNLAKRHRPGWLVGVDWPMVADSSTRARHRSFAILFTSVALYSKTTERSTGLEDLHSTIAN